MTVQEVIEAYCDAYRTIHFRQIESAILVPQCLTLKSYFEKQKKGELSAALVNHIATQFDNFRQETEVETIISGIDDEGTHIYVIKNDEVRCESNNGYAAIGLGGWHAESQFMFAKYTSAWTLTDALFLAFKAKKRAEVAEGIGESTDMVTILPVNDRNPFITISRKRLEIFSEYYKQLEDVMASNEQKARDALKESYEETRSETIKHAAKADEAAIETKSDDKSDDERDF